MSVKLFYDPYRVEQFRARGINPRHAPAPAPAALPVVRAVPGPRTIAASRSVPKQRLAPDLVEENARLQAEIVRLRSDNQRLTAEVARLLCTPAARQDSAPLREDDAAARLGLFQLDP